MVGLMVSLIIFIFFYIKYFWTLIFKYLDPGDCDGGFEDLSQGPDVFWTFFWTLWYYESDPCCVMCVDDNWIRGSLWCCYTHSDPDVCDVRWWKMMNECLLLIELRCLMIISSSCVYTNHRKLWTLSVWLWKEKTTLFVIHTKYYHMFGMIILCCELQIVLFVIVWFSIWVCYCGGCEVISNLYIIDIYKHLTRVI
jgi:hypothetical protein